MARVTVEDCIDKVENRFDLVLLASHRARMVSSGSPITVERDNDKNPVVALRDYFTPQGPATAACLGCHDNSDAAAHAYLNTTNFGGTGTAEACGACHSAGHEWAVDKVHAR